MNGSALTELFGLIGGSAQHHVPYEEINMAEDDQRRRGSWAAVVLLDQLVSLELPYPVRVVLHLLEGEAEQEARERR